MKKLILFAAAIMMTGCGFMLNGSSSNTASTQATQTTPVRNSSSTAAMSAGQGAGSALQSIYTQYKADGKFDYKNMQNILNTVTLVANCEGLKDNIKNTTYLKDFGKGHFDEIFKYDAALSKYVYTEKGLTKAMEQKEKKIKDSAT